jgi:anhydro-N-acetylmuramic acid kinase
MRVVGMLSGTSIDAIDVAVVDVDRDGDELLLRRVAEVSVPFDDGLRGRIQAVLPPAPSDTRAWCRLDADLGRAFGDAARGVIDRHGGGHADLVVSHGQTIHHEVTDAGVDATLQIGQPAEIAERTGLPVVSDLRARDVAAGGQGAPLVSILDELVLAGGDDARAACNLGGIANLTVVRPDGPPVAFDAGPANALLDLVVADATAGREHHDPDGHRTAAGTVDEALLAVLLEDAFLAAPAPKSTGKERYHQAYLDAALARAPVSRLDDLLATLAEAVAVAVADHVSRYGVRQVLVSGGGVHNRGLLTALGRRLAAIGCALDTTDTLGIPVDGKEAIAFALLGWLSWHGLPGALPSCTGARGPRILGSLTPGREPLHLPPPLGAPPRRARVLAPTTPEETM